MIYLRSGDAGELLERNSPFPSLWDCMMVEIADNFNQCECVVVMEELSRRDKFTLAGKQTSPSLQAENIFIVAGELAGSSQRRSST